MYLHSDVSMNKTLLHSGIYALLLGASLVAHVWAAGLWFFSLETATLMIISVVLVVCGFVALAAVKQLCRFLFRLATVPAWMEVLAQRHAQALSLARPQLYQLSGTGINAFALSGLGGTGIILFHTNIIRQLTQDEIEAVIAHELAHLSERHSTVMTFLQGMAMPLVVPAALLVGSMISLLYGVRGFRVYFVNAYSLFSLSLFPLTSILIALVSRHWEYRADAIAAQLVGSDRYIAALRCLHGMFFQHPDLLSMTVMAAHENRRDEWALSHPGLHKRIAALHRIGE